MKKLLFFIVILFISSCEDVAPPRSSSKSITIFFVNDQHGSLDNFAKIKHIVDQEKEENAVILACSGDIFSGNPVVDNHAEKGFPIIDVMNKVGFDISVLGNHEFDYGEAVLKKRMEQADFEWVCANVDMQNTGIPEPAEFKTLTVDGLNITFLGLVETNGKPGAVIPSTHPWQVKNISFDRPENVVSQYATLKNQENADVLIALTHLGYSRSGSLGDVQLAQQYPYFDLIIGGHSHQRINEEVNETPIFQAGSNLGFLGKIELKIKNKAVVSYNYELIDLHQYSETDAGIKAIIDNYNAAPELNEVIGEALANHNSLQVGCFFTDALKQKLKVDLSFQNTGGIRSVVNQGPITKRTIYEVDPFNNGTIIYQMTVSEVKTFLRGSNQGFFYTGLQIQQLGSSIQIFDGNGSELVDSQVISVGINDYIPAVFDNYFPEDGAIQQLTSSETLIAFLQDINSQIDYTSCTNYFRYQ